MIFILVTLVVLPMETERYTQLTAMQSKCVLGLVGIHGEGPGLRPAREAFCLHGNIPSTPL